MRPEKQGEVLAFFWLIVSALTFLSLFSYTPYDIRFEVSTPNSSTQNFCGIAGAYTAWMLMLLFGKTAYFLVPLFLFWALAQWAGRKNLKLWLKIFSTVIFFLSACALFSLLNASGEVSRFQAGGILGFFTGTLLTSIFGQAGIFVALSLFLLSILLATELLVLPIVIGLFQKIRAFFEVLFAAKRKARPEKAAAAVVGIPKPEPRVVAPKPVQVVPAILEKPAIKLFIPKEEPKPASKPKPASVEAEQGVYQLPSLDLLEKPPKIEQRDLKENLESSSKMLEDTLKDFGIEAKVVEVEQGPTITRYELQPAAGVKVQRITALENDIALAMRATSVRILAPIPGKSRVGVEVPNSATSTVYLREILESSDFQKETSKIALALGKDTGGAPMVCNLADMPHFLIAGATNTGKSVCINSVITSILFNATPDEVKFILIDPKMVELHFFNHLPHLVCPVVTDRGKVPGVLAWLVSEMERRYKVLAKAGAKNILAFNEKVSRGEVKPTDILGEEVATPGDPLPPIKKMPYIVTVIDELADLMAASAQEVEGAIMRLAQLARAVGIHMVLATQRPSVDVITGVIKANFPARVAFQVASKVDSRTILDENGADKLLGRGDFLFMDPRKSKLIRGQGAWTQDKEIERVVQFIRHQRKAAFDESVLQSAEKKVVMGDFKRDEVYEEAKRVVLETGQASVSMVQRRLGVGYTRAARLIDMMEEDGVVGPYRGAKPREILVDRASQKSQEAKRES